MIQNLYDLNFLLIYGFSDDYFLCEFCSQVVGTMEWNECQIFVNSPVISEAPLVRGSGIPTALLPKYARV
jgi:hypothetical protein